MVKLMIIFVRGILLNKYGPLFLSLTGLYAELEVPEPPDAATLQAARNKRDYDKMMWGILQEVFFYLFFLVLICFIAWGGKDDMGEFKFSMDGRDDLGKYKCPMGWQGFMGCQVWQRYVDVSTAIEHVTWVMGGSIDCGGTDKIGKQNNNRVAQMV